MIVEEEGLFRVSGKHEQVLAIKKQLDDGLPASSSLFQDGTCALLSFFLFLYILFHLHLHLLLLPCRGHLPLLVSVTGPFFISLTSPVLVEGCHTVTSVMKMFVRELPDSLIPKVFFSPHASFSFPPFSFLHPCSLPISTLPYPNSSSLLSSPILSIVSVARIRCIGFN